MRKEVLLFIFAFFFGCFCTLLIQNSNAQKAEKYPDSKPKLQEMRNINKNLSNINYTLRKIERNMDD